MRKTPPHNPRGFERNSWGYRCLQLRFALGWSQQRLAKVMGSLRSTVCDIESGKVTRPTLATIKKIKNLESAYADILTIYKRNPVRMRRLRRKEKGRSVHLLPIEIRRPKDIETLDSVGTDSEPLFFGRGTRRRMQQTGMSLRRKTYFKRRGKAIASALRAKAAESGRVNGDSSQVQSRQPNDKRG